MTNNKLHDSVLFYFGIGVAEALVALGRNPDRGQVESIASAAIRSASSLVAAYFGKDPVKDFGQVKAIGDRLIADLFKFFDDEAVAKSQVN